MSLWQCECRRALPGRDVFVRGVARMRGSARLVLGIFASSVRKPARWYCTAPIARVRLSFVRAVLVAIARERVKRLWLFALQCNARASGLTFTSLRCAGVRYTLGALWLTLPRPLRTAERSLLDPTEEVVIIEVCDTA